VSENADRKPDTFVLYQRLSLPYSVRCSVCWELLYTHNCNIESDYFQRIPSNQRTNAAASCTVMHAHVWTSAWCTVPVRSCAVHCGTCDLAMTYSNTEVQYMLVRPFVKVVILSRCHDKMYRGTRNYVESLPDSVSHIPNQGAMFPSRNCPLHLCSPLSIIRSQTRLTISKAPQSSI
jgi:hypothetical protein